MVNDIIDVDSSYFNKKYYGVYGISNDNSKLLNVCYLTNKEYEEVSKEIKDFNDKIKECNIEAIYYIGRIKIYDKDDIINDIKNAIKNLL